MPKILETLAEIQQLVSELVAENERLRLKNAELTTYINLHEK